MPMTHSNLPPAKRIRVQSDINPQPQWLLIPKALRTIQDLVKSLLVRLELPHSFSYDLCLDGAPILPNEDVALVRDGEQLHLRQREPSSPLPLPPNLIREPQHLSMSSAPEDIQCDSHRKRKRVLTPEGKRRRNARNRKREKRRRLERREMPDNHQPLVPNSQRDDPDPREKATDGPLSPSNKVTDEVEHRAMNERETAEEDENPPPERGAKNNNDVSPAVHNSECTRDEEVTVNISFTNDVADEQRPIAVPAVGVVQHGPALSADGQKPNQSLNESEPASTGDQNWTNTFKNLNPRWKRQRSQSRRNPQEQPDSPSVPIARVENMEHTHRGGPSVTTDAPPRLEVRDTPGHDKDALPEAKVGETAPSPIDVINLIELEEDCARAIDRLQGPHQSPTNSSKSNSPQSIVVSPAEPRETILATVNTCKEVSKQGLEAGADTGTSNKETDPMHDIQKTITENTVPVHTSRRKQTSPMRLTKPGADVGLNSVIGRERAISPEEPGSVENLPESLQALEHLGVTDGLENSDKEHKELQVSIGSKCQPNTGLEPADSLSIEGTQEAVGKATEPDKSRLVLKDTKKKPSCLKGGMSTLDALRVARAHQAKQQIAEKQMEGPDPQTNAEVMPTENTDGTQKPKSDSNGKRAGGKSRKRSKRNKRSKTTMRYLNEQQINKSTFVGHRPETMLPPLELLDFPDGANELRQAVDVPATLQDTPRSSPETNTDEQRDVEVVPEPHPRDETEQTEGNPVSAKIATTPDLLGKIQMGEIQSKSTREETGHATGEPSSRVGEPSGLNNNQPEEQASDQRRNGKHREGLSHNLSESQRTAAVNSLSPQFRTGDSFREDLFETLQYTGKTLAEVWAKWDNC